MTTASIVLLIFLAAGVAGGETPAPTETVDSPSTISAVRITINDPPRGPASTDWAAMAESFISIRPEDTLSGEIVDAAIASLKASGQFSAIHVDTRQEGDHLILLFDLTPARLIKRISIHKPFPLFQKQVRRVMSLAEGNVFNEEKLPDQADRIEALYRQEGFISPAAVVTASMDPGDGQAIIDVFIRKGDFFRLSKFEIKGNAGFSNARIKSRLGAWFKSKVPLVGGRLSQEGLKADKKSLVDFYRKRGYPEVAVNFQIEKNEQEKTVDWIVDIQEGPRYTVEFKGNRHFSSRNLKKDLVIFKTGNNNDAGVKKSVRTIRDRYRNAGFEDVDVTFQGQTQTVAGKPVRQVVISIDEGIQTVVNAVTVTGNRSLPEKVVAKELQTRPPGFFSEGGYAPEVLAEDLEALRALYLKKGYMSPAIQDAVVLTPERPDRTAADVDIRIDEGTRSLVTHVTLKGVYAITETQGLTSLKLKPGAPFREYMLKSDENTLAGLISEKGHPHVRVQGTADVDQTTRQVRIVYRVEQGPLVRMGQTYCRGNFRTREDIILRKVSLQPGDPLSLKSLLESQKEIRNLGALSSANFRYVGLEEKADTVDVIIEVKEKKPYYVESGLGYDTERGFFADARLGDLNLMGADRNLWLAGDISDIGYQTELGFMEPELFDTRVSSLFSLYAERRKEFNVSFGVDRAGAALLFSRKWSERLRAGLGFRLERREQYDRSLQDVLQPEELEPRTLFAVTPSIQYDGRDSFVRPRKGFALTFEVDVSSALVGDLDNFLNYRLSGQYYVTPFGRLTLAFIGRLGYLDPYGNDLVPEDQLYFLGGASTVRGYQENLLRFNEDDQAVGGREAVSGTVEARIDMGNNLELALFVDTGRVGEPILEVGPAGFRSSVGGGVRYLTPVGPIGLLYGYKLNRLPEESPGRFHFSIGYSF